jgi:hypothetical protein
LPQILLLQTLDCHLAKEVEQALKGPLFSMQPVQSKKDPRHYAMRAKQLKRSLPHPLAPANISTYSEVCVLFNGAFPSKPNFDMKLLKLNLDPCDCPKTSLLRTLYDIYLKGRLNRAGFSKRSRFDDTGWFYGLNFNMRTWSIGHKIFSYLSMFDEHFFQTGIRGRPSIILGEAAYPIRPSRNVRKSRAYSADNRHRIIQLHFV